MNSSRNLHIVLNIVATLLITSIPLLILALLLVTEQITAKQSSTWLIILASGVVIGELVLLCVLAWLIAKEERCRLGLSSVGGSCL